jgi:hypothetical protein
LLSLEDGICRSKCRIDQFHFSRNNSCIDIQQRAEGLVIKTLVAFSSSLSALKKTVPVLMASSMGPFLGGFIFIVAQSYSKLMMIPHLNFDLGESLYSDYFYLIFQTFIDDLNNRCTSFVYGKTITA